jgi:peptide/nickel transport system substrate-binding protein
MLYTTANITGTAFRNASGYSNPEVDRLVDEAAKELDEAKRRDLLHRVQRITAEDLPVLVLAYKQNMTFAQRRVRNHSARPEWMYDSWKDLWLEG